MSKRYVFVAVLLPSRRVYYYSPIGTWTGSIRGARLFFEAGKFPDPGALTQLERDNPGEIIELSRFVELHEPPPN